MRAVVLVGRAVRDGEARGAVEDDDVAAMHGVTVGQLVDQDAVARLDGRLHGARRHVERLHEETPDQEHHQQGDAAEQQPRRAASGAFGRGRSVGLEWRGGRVLLGCFGSGVHRIRSLTLRAVATSAGTRLRGDDSALTWRGSSRASP